MIMCLKCSRGPMDAASHCPSPRTSRSGSSLVASSDEIEMPRATNHYLRPSLRPRLRDCPGSVSGGGRNGLLVVSGTPSARVARFHEEAQVFTFEPQVEPSPQEVRSSRNARAPRKAVRVKYPAQRAPRRGPPSEKNPAKGWLAFFAVVVAFQVFNAAENLDDYVSSYNLDVLEERLCSLDGDSGTGAARAAVSALHRYLSVHSHAEPLVLWLHGCGAAHAEAIANHFGEAATRLNVRSGAGAGNAAAFDLRARLGGIAAPGADGARGGEKIPVVVLEGDSDRLAAALRTLASSSSSPTSSWSSSHSWFSLDSHSSSGGGGASNAVLVVVEDSVSRVAAAAAELARLVELGAISEHSTVVDMSPAAGPGR